MKQIPKTAYINLDINLDIENWLTEDDKQSILENHKNQSEIDMFLHKLISDNLSHIISYNSINIDFE